MDILHPDSNPKLKAALPYLRNIYTALFGSLTALLYSFILYDGYTRTYNDYRVDIRYSVQVVLVVFLPLVIIAATAIVYDYFDNVDLFAKREYFEAKSKKPLIGRYPYVVGFALSMLFSTLILKESFHFALSFFFPDINVAAARFLAVATMAVLRLYQIRSLQEKWQTEIENPLFVEKAMFKRNRDMYAFKPHQFILQPIGYFLAFGALCVFVSYLSFPYLIFAATITGLNIILSPDLWWSVFAIPLIIVAVVFAVRLIHNTRKRLILLRKLKQIESEGLGRVEISGSKYLSATFISLPFNVKITDREGEVYNCVVATCGEINAPMFFKLDEYIVEHGFHLRGGALLARGGSFGQIVDVSKMGGKENPTNLIFGFRTSHKLKFPEGEGHNVVILNPTPTTAYAMWEREYFPIDTGEDMGDYTIYTASGIFNHIERQSRKGRYDYDY